MPRAPRRETSDDSVIGIYHCANRCVCRAFLCGQDRTTGRSFDHRRQWVRERLEELASIFAIDHLNFSVMENHLHALLRNRPDIRDGWSNEEVVLRWWRLFPQRRDSQGQPGEMTDQERQAFLANPEWIAERRRRLGHISWFMRCLDENIAKRANAEEGISSRFWQGRFKAQRILDECGLLACAMYIDLNPIRARLAETPETSCFTSVFERITARSEEGKRKGDGPQGEMGHEVGDVSRSERARDGWLSPVELAEASEGETPPVRRASNRGYLPMTFEQYLALLDWTGREIRSDKRGSIPEELLPILQRLGVNDQVWVDAVKNFGRWFRTAVGRVESLLSEAGRRGRRYLQGMGHCRVVFT